MKVAVYARYSSSAQNEQSIEGQLRKCHDYAKQHDMTIVTNYIDRALSARTDDRAEFQRMIRDSAGQGFEAVLLYKMDRFARNRYDSAIYKAKLKKNDVKVLYACESIPDGPEGIILESLLEGMAEYYSVELSQKVKRGRLENAYKGLSNGGSIPLGYKIMDKRYTIDENQSPTVQYIFDQYNNGVPVKEICNVLNSRGIKTSKGYDYNKNSLRRMLQNKKYIGIYEMEGIMLTDAIPPIIDKEIFEQVQKRIKFNRRSPASAKAKERYLLSGKLYCGHCGAGMVGESGTGKSGARHHYYACVNKRRTKTCSKKNVKKDWIEDTIVTETVQKLLQPEIIALIAKRCIAIYQKESADNSELQCFQKQLSETKKSIANILNAIEQGVFTKSTKERLASLEETQENLEFEISVANTKPPELTEEHIIYMLTKFQHKSTQSLQAYKEEIIDCFIDKVYLYDDKIVITYNLSDKESTLLKSDIDRISSNIGGCESSYLGALGSPVNSSLRGMRRLFCFACWEQRESNSSGYEY